MAEAGECSSHIIAFGAVDAILSLGPRLALSGQRRNPHVLLQIPQRTPSLPLMGRWRAYRQPQFCRRPDAQEGGMEQEEPAGQDTLILKKSRNCAHQPNPLDQTQ